MPWAGVRRIEGRSGFGPGHWRGTVNTPAPLPRYLNRPDGGRDSLKERREQVIGTGMVNRLEGQAKWPGLSSEDAEVTTSQVAGSC